MNKKGQLGTKFFLGIAVMLIGSIGSILWGLGLSDNNPILLWSGRLLVASLPFIVVIFERFIEWAVK